MKFLSGNSISTTKELYSRPVLRPSPGNGEEKEPFPGPRSHMGTFLGERKEPTGANRAELLKSALLESGTQSTCQHVSPEVLSVLLPVMDDWAQPHHCQKLM